MKLSSVPFDRIEIGKEVVSAIGNFGVVSHKTREGEIASKTGLPARYDEIEISWYNGKSSLQFHQLLDKVEIIQYV